MTKAGKVFSLGSVWMALMLAPTACSAQESPFSCVQEITIPRFDGILVRQVTDSASVSVTVGRRGKASKIRFAPADSPLRGELQIYFGEMTKYSENCRGRTITFVVSYEFSGEPTVYPSYQVKLRLPNEIVLTCHPLKWRI